MKVKLRFVIKRGVRYVRVEDVASFFLKLSSTLETDINLRRRLDVAANELIKALD